ncbi:quinol:cytochrome C oxidoreductase [Humisphaera borealis]|uniref:Quinol:cytochrome C oxidoreductase n=1 Tax=Humisphaera borealis TaxID=2807512 RepID=A0A7M2WSD4_9BACT|nr:quinol:cytochrome C oxidoreductase [Humisphaera borealis]
MKSHTVQTSDITRLGPGSAKLVRVAGVIGVVGLGAAIASGLVSAGGYRRFLFAYLVAFCFCLTIALGALIFVLLQHLTRAGWSVTVRRPAEAIAATLPVLGLLSLPILFSVASADGALYRWALPVGQVGAEEPSSHVAASPHKSPSTTAGEAVVRAADSDPAQLAKPVLDSLILRKRAWLNPAFWIVRVVGYFAIWSLIARWYRAQSAVQDRTGDAAVSTRMQWWAPLAIIATGLTVTLAAFDLVMSLDPHWYSTIFGVYFLAGSFVASFAALIVAVFALRTAGFVRSSLSTEHFHDLGKYLFAFVFFWGYIAFSQFMLLWYANIPEETRWFARHGATTVQADISGWSFVILAILFGHLLIPFAGLLSRHIKRSVGILVFWAVWLLAFHYLDLYWVILPEAGGDLNVHLADVAALVGVLGVFVAAAVRLLACENLIPTADPRLHEALAFHNI